MGFRHSLVALVGRMYCKHLLLYCMACSVRVGGGNEGWGGGLFPRGMSECEIIMQLQP